MVSCTNRIYALNEELKPGISGAAREVIEREKETLIGRIEARIAGIYQLQFW